MSFSNKIYKDTLSCRLSPHLKIQVQEDASSKGLTTSNYIERILEDRNWIMKEEERDRIVYENQHLEGVVNTLKQELEEERNLNKNISEALRDKNKVLDLKLKEIEQLNQQILSIRKESLSFDFEQMDMLKESIEQLQKDYPDITTQDLIIASLGASVKNENSTFSIHLIKGQLK